MSVGITITEENFEAEITNYDKPIIIDFWAEWCGPCKAFMPVVEKFAAAHPEIKVCNLNVDNAPGISRQFSVMSIPTLVLFDKGQPINTVVGTKKLQELEDIAKNSF